MVVFVLGRGAAERRAGGRPRVRTGVVAVLGLALAAAACSRGGSERVASSGIDPSTGTRASPRVVANGPIPKGGGVYKVGVPYQVAGRWYHPRIDPAYDRTGIASWYGDDFHGRKTANGEIYDMWALSAAHPTMPLPSYAWVTNLANGRTILVRVNDRGPYAHDRIIDMSRRAARALGFEHHGTTQVRVRYAGGAPMDGNDARERQHLASQPWASDGAIAANGSGRSPAWPGRSGLGAADREIFPVAVDETPLPLR